MTGPEPQAQTFTPTERKLTMAGVLLVFLLSALDQTIVSTAMPKIISQLHGLNLYAWVTTAYMLSSTVMVPIYGKLNDIFGRKPILIVGISLFIAGSALCGLAGEFGPLPVLGGGMTQLIVFRGLQGLGGGALFTSAFAIIADLYPPRERSKFAGMFGGVFGLASVVGPVLGGFFTDLGAAHIGGLAVAGWRWIFYVNLPISAAALFMIVAMMPRLTHRRPGKVDFAGAGLIIVTLTPLLLALSWGGRDYGWGSPLILGLLAVSALGLGAFLWVESVVSNPILSLSLFQNRVFSTTAGASFFTTMAFMGTTAFLPLYMQVGQGRAATASGLATLPLMLGMLVTSAVCGQLISRTGRYKPFLVASAVLIVLGLALISDLSSTTPMVQLTWRLLVLGVGLGPSMSTYSIAVQNAVPREHIGVATSSSQFFRQIGGTVGVAVFGAILTHNLATETAHGGGVVTLADLQRQGMVAAQRGAAAASAAPSAAELHLRVVMVQALHGVFLAGLGVAAVALGLVMLIPALPLRSHAPAVADPPEPAGEAEAAGEPRIAAGV